MKRLFLIVLLLLTACEKKSHQIDKEEHEFYKCHVRVELIWDKKLSYLERNRILDKFNKSMAKGGGEVFGMTLNNHDELLHFYVGGQDYSCPPNFEKSKYKDVQRVLDKYLKPIKDSPKYQIYKQPLKKDEFEGLELVVERY